MTLTLVWVWVRSAVLLYSLFFLLFYFLSMWPSIPQGEMAVSSLSKVYIRALAETEFDACGP